MVRTRKLRFRNLFLLIFVSYLIVLLIPIAMTGAIYFRSETVVQDQIMDSNQAVLRQMKSTVDDRLNEIEQLASQIFLDQNTQKLMNTSGVLEGSNMMKAANLLKAYTSYKNITPFIDNFFVYFYNLDYLLTSSAVCKPAFYFDYFIDADQNYEAWKKEYFLSYHSGGIASRTVLNFKKGEPMLCFWTSLPSATSETPLGNICIMVSAGSFQELLSSVEEIHGGMAFVLDSGGELVFTSNGANAALLPDLTGLSGDGEVVSAVGGVDYVFSYTDSAASGLKYVTAFPKDVLQAEVGYMRRFAQMMIYICVSAALLLILWLTYSNYKPIRSIASQFDEDAEEADRMSAYQYIEHSVRKITSKNEQFQAAMENYQPLFRSNFLSKLISGAVTDETEIADALRSYGIGFSGGDFAVLLMHIEDSSRFMKDNSEKERNYVRLILSNIGEELAESAGTGSMAETGGDTFCLVVNLLPMDRAEEKKAARALAERVKGAVERYFGIVMTVSIGGIFEGFPGIHQSYLEASRALDYRLIQGISAIISADDLKQTSSTYYYPTETENRLLNLVRSGDYGQAEALLGGLFDENFKVRRLSLSIGKCFFFDMVSTAVKLLDLMNVESESVFADISPIEELLQCDTVDQMQQKLLWVFRKLCDYANDNKKSHNNELKADILSYITANYADENLSQTMIADHFGISPNYLSNFFHEQTGEKMSAYISMQRIEKAKELLRETDGNMSAVAAAVGFGSDLSLIRVFKKLEGMTPGQYRAQLRRKG